MTDECHVDWQHLHPAFKTFEMVLVEGLSGIVPYLELAFWYHYAGPKVGKFFPQDYLDVCMTLKEKRWLSSQSMQ